MLQHGILAPEQVKQHPDAHVLLRALGGSAGVQQDFKPEVWNEPLELQAGDVVLLCSDGLYDLIEDAELYPLIERRDCLSAVDTLIREANARGGTDNITAILLVAGQPDVPATGASPAVLRRDTIPEAPRVAAPEAPTAPPVVSAAASAWPQPRQTLPELPLVVPVEDASGRAEPVPPESSRMPPPVGSDGRSAVLAQPDGGTPRPTAAPERSSGVSMRWAMGLAAGMLLVGGLLGWVFGRGSTSEGSGPGPVLATSASSVSGTLGGMNVPSGSSDAPAVVPPTAAGDSLAMAARDAGSEDAGAAARVEPSPDAGESPSTAGVPPAPMTPSAGGSERDGGTSASTGGAVTGSVGGAAPAATPAPKSKKKAGSPAQPAPSRPKPAIPGTPASGSASEGQGT
jgi:protein phosphatase